MPGGLPEILTEQELVLIRDLSPEELKGVNREAHEKISQNVVRRTDDWLEHIADRSEV